MNTKMLITQFGLLPEAAISRHINSVLYPVRRAMLLEAAKETPVTELVRSCKELDYIVTSYAPERVHDLESTAEFVFQTGDDTRPAEQRKTDARKRIIRRIAEGSLAKPRTPEELVKLIALELQREDDMRFEGIGKAADALAYIDGVTFTPPDQDCAQTTLSEAMGKAKTKKAKKESLADVDAYDEDSLPDWLKEAIEEKLIIAGERTLLDAQRRLDRARYPHQETGPRADLAAASGFLQHFGITAEMVLRRMSEAEAKLEAEFAEPESVTTIDNPPPENSVQEKRERRRVEKAKSMGITSADMAQAGGTK